MSLIETVPPSVEPITLTEFKSHARIDITDDDDLITNFIIPTARSHVENILRKVLINTTFELRLDCFPASTSIWIPNPPLSSVTSVEYIDENGVSQTLATTEYTVDLHTEPGRIYLQHEKFWPSIRRIQNAVKITFVAGFGSASTSVPIPIRHAILLIGADLYENRENSSNFPSHRVISSAESHIFPYVLHDDYGLQNQSNGGGL